jgi:4-amino-4-deoxychorismate lyase
VTDDDIDYRFKYADRRRLQSLFARRGDCDDVLIVRNGLLTDTSYCNIVLYDGQDWWTPDTPLLPGTARQRLLDEGLIRERRIRVEDLPRFEHIRLINAMLPWEVGGLAVERLAG